MIENEYSKSIMSLPTLKQFDVVKIQTQ